MPYYRYGSSSIGTLFLPLVSRMIIEDEQHQYPWHLYSSNLIHSYYVSLRTTNKQSLMNQKVPLVGWIEFVDRFQSSGSANDDWTCRRWNSKGNA